MPKVCQTSRAKLFEARYGYQIRPMVARGAYLLDHALPGWAKDVNKDSLDIANCTRCVLGQLAPRLSLLRPNDRKYRGWVARDYSTAGLVLSHISETYRQLREKFGGAVRANTELGFTVLEPSLVRLRNDDLFWNKCTGFWYRLLTKYWLEEINSRLDQDKTKA